MRISVVTFPGSNCDHDVYKVCLCRNHQTKLIWHKDTDLEKPDLVILPGGFSYGDYLRCGALARFSPIVKEVIAFAQKGGLLLGICNGFQILTECGLLPGTLLMNENLCFICQHQYIRVETVASPFTQSIGKGKVLDIPIAHKEGNFYIESDGLKQLQDNDQILFRYCDKKGNLNIDSNPNGSLDNIAGICNKQRNILGMMPHPERSATETVPHKDGRWIFAAIEKALE
ncbi:MAG TPA: phosphoribosylformylglycinamidine synthase I [Candidatus Cloacimonas sp.]|nr:phosphoribosylformylglycinamidine synthase I [Candidatus Cloacimonas sp.]HNQ39737.1 phosphoribosylformylglycinamidine synthase I [Candidatus Cloacimonas sp.]HNS84425.1 phosphoribosylformylglycinamidine synthase I [Candidatus Cloacimonas sp.]HPH93315.1 phosphoribosylformylglycinamidine synthase I [Candidatus Cloacimonas sp.]HPX09700.1 phosphoribosylformylglycinamidine synthase I [Candidatus Cloacimonas sp.]